MKILNVLIMLYMIGGLIHCILALGATFLDEESKELAEETKSEGKFAIVIFYIFILWPKVLYEVCTDKDV